MKKLTIIIGMIMVTQFTSAQIIQVPTDYTTIQAAIEAAIDGDTVLVAEGTYFENINFRGKAIMVASHLLLDGDTSHISKTIIDGSQATDPNDASVVSFDNCNDTTTVLNGFTVTGGKGFRLFNGNQYITSAGGINVNNSSGKVTNNIVRGNSILETTDWAVAAGIGVGIFERGDFQVVIRNNRIHNNTTVSKAFSFGAGFSAHIADGYLLIEGNNVYNNTSVCESSYKALGAGIDVEKGYGCPGRIIIRNNFIHHNELHCPASMGGGMYLVYYRDQTTEDLGSSVPMEVYNNIISDNFSEDKGGGVAVWNMAPANGLKETMPDPILSNNTIINNRAADGAGIYNYDAETVLLNNIISNDLSANNCREIFNDDISYPGGWDKKKNDGIIHSFFNNISDGWPGIGNIVSDPAFEADTFLLSSASPCIGRGVDSARVEDQWFYAPYMDYAGADRLLASTDQKIDMGALESPYERPKGTYDSENVINVPEEETTIQAAINAAFEGDTVLVEEGIYYENINFRGKAITVASKYILDGDEDHVAQTVIDGSQPVYPDSASVVTMNSEEDSTSVINGFTLTGGAGTRIFFPGLGTHRAGGGMLSENTGGKIVNNIITGNSVLASGFQASGGGIAAFDFGLKSVVIRNNKVYGNQITSNTYAQGGGIFTGSEGGLTLVENNEVIGNKSICTGTWKANAGGIMLGSTVPWKAKLIVRNNIISENEIHCVTSQGGGIFLTFPDLDEYVSGTSGIQIYNNVIANNYSEDRGGGIAIWDQVNGAYKIEHSNPLIYNNTIVGNTAKEGAGLFNFEMNALLFNNIIRNNINTSGAAEISTEDISYSSTGNLTNHGTFQSWFNNIRGGYPGVGNLDGDPMLDEETFSLSEGSPSIGRGLDSLIVEDGWLFAPSLDFTGSNRRLASTDHKIDMGAIESPYNRPKTGYDSEQLINVPSEESTIQSAINAAMDGDTVLVEEGLYYENINFKGKAITVASEYIFDRNEMHVTQTVIDGSQYAHIDSASVVNMESGEDSTSVLNGFTITGGQGGIVHVGTVATMRAGGGIKIFNSGGKIVNNRIFGNTLYSEDLMLWGAGICIGGGDNLYAILRNNQIYNNHASSFKFAQGGGLGIGGAKRVNVLVEENDIHGNEAKCLKSDAAIGGGVFVAFDDPWNKTLIIRNNRIRENRIAGTYCVGAALYMTITPFVEDFVDQVSKIEIYNNLITDNYSEKFGGGLAIWDQNNALYQAENPIPVIFNNTITGNQSRDATGIFNINMKPLLVNNIFWNEPFLETGKEFYNGNYDGKNDGTFLSYHNCIKDGAYSRWDFMGLPRFAVRSYELTSFSHCIDRGTASVEVNGAVYEAPSTDFSGNPRPYTGNGDAAVDVGALESNFDLFDDFRLEAVLDLGNGNCDASVLLEFSGGKPPFRYYMNGTEYNSYVFEGLCDDTYEFEVKDTTGASLTETVEIITDGISPLSSSVETALDIYPNPVSQVATIRFKLEKELPVRITLLNLLGEEEMFLLNEKRQPGLNEVQFDASGLASGIYFIRMEANKIYMKKIILH